MSDVILKVRGLSVDFATEDGVVHAVKDVSYDVRKGKTLAIEAARGRFIEEAVACFYVALRETGSRK